MAAGALQENAGIEAMNALHSVMHRIGEIDELTGRTICARTASVLGIMPEIVQMCLSVTTVRFLGTLQLSALGKPCVGTARSLDT